MCNLNLALCLYYMSDSVFGLEDVKLQTDSREELSIIVRKAPEEKL